MYLMNKADLTETRPDRFECYTVSVDNQEYFDKKLKEVLSYCNPDLNNRFVFSDRFKHEAFSTAGPLLYPISTMTLVNFSQDNWVDCVDSKVAEYIYNIMYYCDIYDLSSIYEIIRKDPEIEKIDGESLLNSYLETNYKDIAIFRDIFKHFNFTLLYSQNIGNYNIFTNAVKNIKLFKPELLSQVSSLSIADKNTKTLKLLQLTPNIK